MTSPDYNRNYFAANKVAIIAKRAARRNATTEAQRKVERQKARERAAHSRKNLRDVMANLEKVADALETLRPALIEGERMDGS